VPLDTISTSELAALNDTIAAATAQRDAEQRASDRLARSAAFLEEAVAAHAAERAAFDAQLVARP
jgi:hypothetical protein